MPDTLTPSDGSHATLFRPQRHLLAEAMEQVQPCRTRADLARLTGESAADLVVRPYPERGSVDLRIGWHTHIVSIPGQGVFGFTDGPVADA